MESAKDIIEKPKGEQKRKRKHVLSLIPVGFQFVPEMTWFSVPYPTTDLDK